MEILLIVLVLLALSYTSLLIDNTKFLQALFCCFCVELLRIDFYPLAVSH